MDSNIMWTEDGDMVTSDGKTVYLPNNDVPFHDAMAHADQFELTAPDTLEAAGFTQETCTDVAMRHEGVMLIYGYEMTQEESEPWNPDNL